MKLQKLFFVNLFLVNCLIADNRSLAPKYMTEEEVAQRIAAVEAERIAAAVEAERIAAAAEAERIAVAAEAERIAAAEEAVFLAQVHSDIKNFVQASHCDQTAIDFILMYVENKTLWDFCIPLLDPEDDTVIEDEVNVIHLVVMYGKIEQLSYLCKELNKIHRLDFLDVPTLIKGILPTTFCMQYEHWNCLMTLIEYGANGRNLIIPENIATNSEKLKLYENAIKQGFMLHRQYLAQQKMKAKKAEKKARKKIEKLEAKAAKELEDF